MKVDQPRAYRWSEMKELPEKRYVPRNHKQNLLERIARSQQGSMTVGEYFEEFRTLSNCSHIVEPECALLLVAM